VRNRSISWVFLDTGMRVSELCGLRLSDVNYEQRALRVQRALGKEHWLSLSPNGWFQLLSYLEQHRPKGVHGEHEGIEKDHLFLSEWYRPLTINGTTLLFDRLKKRAGMSEKSVSPSVLRDTCAVRFLQAGGEPEALQALLGLRGNAALKRYEQLSFKKIANDPQQKPDKKHPSGPQSVPPRRSTAPGTWHHRHPEASKAYRRGKKKPANDAARDP
jgi:site-specific recombinase XerD